MVIYNNYTTFNLLLNEPCEIEGLGKIYPISVKEYQKFQKYIKYLMFSKNRIESLKNISLLDGVIIMMAGASCKNPQDIIELYSQIVVINKELCELFSMLTHKEVFVRKNKKNQYLFEDIDGDVFINGDNFEALRQAVAKMCLIKEPKVFKDKITQKWYEKALIAKRAKSPEITLEDIIIAVSQDMKMSFEEIGNLNIFQLYSYYYRINHVENYKAITLFRTCSASKLPDINYSDGTLSSLYKEESLNDLTISADSLGKML